MIKPGPTYKMSKSLKVSLALSRYVKDPHLLGAIKRSGIQAELMGQVKHKNKNQNSD
jgi:hypothetical protein